MRAARRIELLMLKRLPFFPNRKLTGDVPTRDDTATAFGIFWMSLHNIRIEDRVKRSYTLYN